MKNLFSFISLALVFCPILWADTPTAADLAGQLHLQKVETKPFHIEFRGYQELNGEFVFQLYSKDMSRTGQPPLLKKGNAVGFSGWVVGDFTPNSVPGSFNGQAVAIDKSTLELINPDTGTRVTVPFRGEINSLLPVATFVQDRVANSATTVTQGEKFNMPDTPQLKFVFVKLVDQGAIIRSVSDQEEFTIPKSDTFESK